MKCKSKSLWARRAGLGLAAVAIVAAPAVASELLVSSAQTDQVLRYDGTTGTFTDVFISGGGLDQPEGLLLGSDGNVYVASYNTDSVKRYDGTTGAYIDDFVAAGLGGLNGPYGMCWGPDGNLYVAGSLSNNVIRYQGLGGATPGALIDVFVAAGSGGLAAPRAVHFGNDQYTGGAPGPAQDGYPELFVASYNSGKLLRFNGLTGAYLDIYADVGSVTDFLYENAYEDSNRYDTLQRGNLLVSSAGNGSVEIFSGTFSNQEHKDYFGDPGFGNYYGPFFVGLASPRGLAWGPDRGKNGTVGNYDMFQDLYVGTAGGNNVHVVGSDESDLSDLFASGLGGLSSTQYIMFKCGTAEPPVIRKVLNNNALQGSTHTLILQGDNLGSLTNVRLRKMRLNGTLAWDGTAFIDPVGGSMQMVGNDLHVNFDLTGAEAGRYGVVPTDSCGMAAWFPDAVLIYMPELTNTGFEVGAYTDRENLNICDSPGDNGNKSRPKHWEVQRYGDANQWDIRRDGNIWHPCDNGVPKGMTGLHYGTVQVNIGGIHFDEVAMFQTITAPHVSGQTSTQDYSVYVDARMASFTQESVGYIRLLDGTDKDKWNGQVDGSHVIAETQILNTQGIDPDGIVRDPSFVATVPAGYIYQTNPPVLTVMFVLESYPGDEDPTWGGLKALHVDNVRNTYQPCDRSPWADADVDGDVDQDDFAEFQRCLSLGTAGADAAEACLCFDRDANQEINLDDFAQFALCGTGPGVVIAPPTGCE